MTKKILTSQLPLYVVILAFSAALAIGGFFFVRFRTEIYNYTLSLPSANPADDVLQFGSWPALANGQFFEQVRQRMTEEKLNFIEADLSEMKLRVYRKGEIAKEFPILTKGRPGSWWETPAGIYKVEGKIENHFSAFARVYLPWSLPFQGNFFIHGWPYYPDGTPVSTQYSGGCIRLSTDDAKALFDMVDVGTPVLVFERDFARDGFSYAPRIEGVSADGYLAADIKNNFVFAERKSNEIMPVASLTKLMTALVAVEYINIEKELTVPDGAIVKTSIPRLKTGEKLSLYNLLYPLLLESSNEAAETIARTMGRDRFIRLMNQKAQAIGMTNTVFTDPSGSDAGNVSTAQDLFAFAKYLYYNRSFILRFTSGTADTRAYGAPLFTNLQNFNVFTGDPEFVGGKVGLSSSAKQTILSVFEAEMDGEKRPLVVVLLGSEDNASEARALYNWVKTNY